MELLFKPTHSTNNTRNNPKKLRSSKSFNHEYYGTKKYNALPIHIKVLDKESFLLVVICCNGMLKNQYNSIQWRNRYYDTSIIHLGKVRNSNNIATKEKAAPSTVLEASERRRKKRQILPIL